MTVKLVDLFGTRYLYVTFKKNLEYFFGQCIKLMNGETEVECHAGNDFQEAAYTALRNGEEVLFDVADARITSDLTTCISNYQRNHVRFIDSEDEERNKILLESTNRIENYAGLQTTPMPAYTNETDPFEYIKSLEKDKVYATNMENNLVNVPLVTLIMIYRPSIKVNMDYLGVAVFTYIAKHMSIDELDRFNEFYVVESEGIHVSPKDKLYTQRFGIVSLEEANSAAVLVPTDFGSRVLKDDPTFRSIAMECMTLLNKYRSTRRKTLAEVLGKEEHK